MPFRKRIDKRSAPDESDRSIDTQQAIVPGTSFYADEVQCSNGLETARGFEKAYADISQLELQ